MGKLQRISKQKLHDLRWWFIKLFWRPNPQPEKVPVQKEYAIAIATYSERYESYLQPLVKCLVTLFPDTQIIVAANGHHDQEGQTRYLKSLQDFCDGYPNVEMFSYNESQGLCKLWNQSIIRAKTPRVFLFNDDISISKKFRSELEDSGITDADFGLINGSYSHYLVSKSVIQRVGWFDERFPGIGYEDHDYEIRMTLKNKEVKFFDLNSVKNENVVPKDWSWGDAHDVIFNKYSGPNEEHYFNKWSISKTPQEGHVFVRIVQGYAQLKPGMETPNFYPEHQW